MTVRVSITAVIMLVTNVAIADISPFTSDGCSAFPDGTPEQGELWLDCCRAHDYAYWKGGTYEERLEADEALKMCVEKVGEPQIAELMLLGVRVGGTPYFPTRFRWGYGWPYFRGYKEVSEAELHEIQAQEQKDEDSQM